MTVVLEAEGRNGSSAVALNRRSLVTDATIKLGLAKLTDPNNRESLVKIIKETGTQRELNGFARTLASNGEDFARSILRWAVIDELKHIKP